jgi:hypothetical protein
MSNAIFNKITQWKPEPIKHSPSFSSFNTSESSELVMGDQKVEHRNKKYGQYTIIDIKDWVKDFKNVQELNFDFYEGDAVRDKRVAFKKTTISVIAQALLQTIFIPIDKNTVLYC